MYQWKILFIDIKSYIQIPWQKFRKYVVLTMFSHLPMTEARRQHSGKKSHTEGEHGDEELPVLCSNQFSSLLLFSSSSINFFCHGFPRIKSSLISISAHTDTHTFIQYMMISCHVLRAWKYYFFLLPSNFSNKTRTK